MSTLNRRFLFIVFLVVASFFFALPQELTLFNQKITRPTYTKQISRLVFTNDLDYKLGLDLAGGSQITLEADMSAIETADRPDALASLQETISRRVDLFGVTEPTIRTLQVADNYQVVVELPGLTDPAEALTLIGSTAKLAFHRPIIPEGETASSAAIILAFVPTDLTGTDLKRSSVTFDPKTGEPVISLQFNEEGTKKFAELTKELLGQPLAIYLDDQQIMAPVVQAEILSGQAVISGSFSTGQAKTISTQLNAGALPVPVKVISQQNIAPTLGAQSIQKSVRAGLIGLLAVIVFISLYYRLMGVIASLGLLIYGLLSLSLYKILGVTLTLPGIAGFILSVGMAVDSNILIFERYKEELKTKSWTVALELAFGKAWDSIKDANTTTIITALILFNPLNWSFLPTSGPVRGFALTLLLGVLLSLFTGIYVTRTLLRLFFRGKNSNQPKKK